MHLLVVSLDDNRHSPILLPRNASNTCDEGCYYTSAPTYLHPTSSPKSTPTSRPFESTSKPQGRKSKRPTGSPKSTPTSRPFKSTYQPQVRKSNRPTWASTQNVTTSPEGTSTQIPSLSPLIRTILTTFSPTVSNTHQPTIHSTIVPSLDRRVFLQTHEPSVAKITFPTNPPDFNLHSRAPTSIVRATSTGNPSSDRGVNSFTKTKAPSQAICKARNDGTYGTFPVDTTANFIDYDYRLETQSTVTVSTISTQILPSLEKAIVDQLIPTFFASSCGLQLTGASLRGLVQPSSQSVYVLRSEVKIGFVGHQRYLETIVGISSYPPDLVQASCKPSLNETYSCVIIKGRLTVYGTSEVTNSSALQLTSAKVICDAMSNGQLAKSQLSVASLQCINTNNTASISIEGGNGPTEVLLNRGVPFYTYIIGAAAFGIVLIAIFAYMRRKMTRSTFTEETEEEGDMAVMEADATDSNIDQLGESDNNDDLGSIPSLDNVHNLLITEGLEEITTIPENRQIEVPSSDSLNEVLEISSDCDSTTAKGDEPDDAYDFAPVLCSISSPRVLASFAKSSYFPEKTDAE